MAVSLGGLSDMKILDAAMAEADVKGVRLFLNGLGKWATIYGYNLNS